MVSGDRGPAQGGVRASALASVAILAGLVLVALSALPLGRPTGEDLSRPARAIRRLAAWDLHGDTEFLCVETISARDLRARPAQ